MATGLDRFRGMTAIQISQAFSRDEIQEALDENKSLMGLVGSTAAARQAPRQAPRQTPPRIQSPEIDIEQGFGLGKRVGETGQDSVDVPGYTQNAPFGGFEQPQIPETQRLAVEDVDDANFQAGRAEGVDARFDAEEDRELSLAKTRGELILQQQNITQGDEDATKRYAESTATPTPSSDAIIAAATEYGTRNPYANREQFRLDIEKDRKFGDLGFDQAVADNSMLNAQITTRDKIDNIFTEGFKNARDGGTADGAIDLLKTRLRDIHQINITPELMAAAGRNLARQTNIINIGEGAREKLSRLMYLEEEISSVAKMMSDPRFISEIQEEFGGWDKHIQFFQALGEGKTAAQAGLGSSINISVLQRMGITADTIARFQSGAALNNEEFKRYFEEWIGGLSSDPERMAIRFSALSSSFAQQRMAILNAAGMAQGRDLLSLDDQGFEKTPSGLWILSKEIDRLEEIKKSGGGAASAIAGETLQSFGFKKIIEED